MKFLSLLLSLIIIANSAYASKLKEEFILSADNTVVGFQVNYLLFGQISGLYRDFKGSFIIDRQIPKNNRADIIIQTNSVNTGSKTRDEQLRGPDLFNSEVYPSIKFQSNAIELGDRNTAKITGELTMLGITKNVVLDLVEEPAENKNYANGFMVTGKIKRSDFGMNAYPMIIGNTVTLEVCYNIKECKIQNTKQ